MEINKEVPILLKDDVDTVLLKGKVEDKRSVETQVEHIHKHEHHSTTSKKAKKRKFRSNTIIISIIFLILVIVILLLAFKLDSLKSNNTNNHYTDITNSTVKIETSVFGEKVLTVSDAIPYYVNSENSYTANEVYKMFSGYKHPLNVGVPLNFTYRVAGLPVGVEIQSAILEISETSDYQDALEYSLDLDDSILDIYNLKTGTKYYYRVNLTLSNANVIGTTGTFETEESPRILNIDGIVNARDIGGWDTTDGYKIKQGLLYRGSELDGAVQAEYKITEYGLYQMRNELKINFDMDLRVRSEDNIDMLGQDIVHKYYEIGMYSETLNNKEQTREMFSDLANPDNYPIYLHCTYGRDRTGTVCYLLEALLGVSDEDLKKEYELSAFTDSYVSTEEFNDFVEKINTFEGSTTQQKVEGYLLSIGVTAEEISVIREIFLEKQ